MGDQRCFGVISDVWWCFFFLFSTILQGTICEAEFLATMQRLGFYKQTGASTAGDTRGKGAQSMAFQRLWVRMEKECQRCIFEAKSQNSLSVVTISAAHASIVIAVQSYLDVRREGEISLDEFKSVMQMIQQLFEDEQDGGNPAVQDDSPQGSGSVQQNDGEAGFSSGQDKGQKAQQSQRRTLVRRPVLSKSHQNILERARDADRVMNVRAVIICFCTVHAPARSDLGHLP